MRKRNLNFFLNFEPKLRDPKRERKKMTKENLSCMKKRNPQKTGFTQTKSNQPNPSMSNKKSKPIDKDFK